MKTLSIVFQILAVLLSDVMCALVAWNYSIMKSNDMFNSAPPSTAFFLAIPFVIGIAVCVVLAVVFWKKAA